MQIKGRNGFRNTRDVRAPAPSPPLPCEAEAERGLCVKASDGHVTRTLHVPMSPTGARAHVTRSLPCPGTGLLTAQP